MRQLLLKLWYGAKGRQLARAPKSRWVAKAKKQKVNPSFVVGTSPNTQRRGLPFPTHTQNKKEQLKLQTQKKYWKNQEKGKTENQKETIEINKHFKNYRK